MYFLRLASTSAFSQRHYMAVQSYIIGIQAHSHKVISADGRFK